MRRSCRETNFAERICHPRPVWLAIALIVSLLSSGVSWSQGYTLASPLTGWAQLNPAHSPNERDGEAMAYDKLHKQVLLFAGESTNSGVYNDTWTWDGSDWTRQFPAHSPSNRDYAQMAYDEVHQQIVLFSGEGAGSDTWIWNGTDWTELSPAHSPPARHNAGMIWDPALQRIVLLDGYSGDNNLNDLWTWDGSDWTEISAHTQPQARGDFGMVYEAATHSILIFGGYSLVDGLNAGISVEGSYLQDTWRWDGTNWTQLAGMNYNTNAQGVLGVVPGNPNLIYGLVQEYFGGSITYVNMVWNGQSWYTADVFGDPSPRYSNNMVYDEDSGQVLIFGGTVDSNYGYYGFGDTWAYQVPQGDMGSVSVCPSGSSGSSCSVTKTFEFTDAARDWRLANQASSSSDFTLDSWNCDGSCWATVTFAPTQPGVRAAALASVPGEPTYFLHGTGLAPQGLFLNPQIQSAAGTLPAPAAVVSDQAGNLFVADSTNQTVTSVPASDPACAKASDCMVVATGLNNPSGLAMDGAGNLLIADTGDNSIQLVLDPLNAVFNTGLTKSAQSNLFTGLSGPVSVAMNSYGSVFIAQSNQTVIEEPWDGGGWNPVITLLSTGNVNASFNPQQVAVAPNGSVFVADEGNGQILELPWTEAGFGTPVAVATGLSSPAGVSVDAMGNLVYFDGGNDQMVRLPWTGTGFGAAQIVAGSAIIGDGVNASRIWADVSGNIDYIDVNAHAVHKLDFSSPSLTFASAPVGQTSSDSPRSATFMNYGNQPLIFNTPSTGTNPSVSQYFSQTGGTCPLLTASSASKSLDPGQSCTVNLNFTPTVGGNIEGSLVVSDNGLNQAIATQSLQLFGSGADVPDHLLLQASSASLPGAPFKMIVSAVDVNGTLMTTYQGTVHFTSSDSTAGLPSDYTFTSGDAGVHVFTVTLNTLGPQTVSAADTSQTTSSDSGTIPIEGSALVAVEQAPVFNSSASTNFYANIANTFTITSTAYPIPSYTLSGSLPSGVSFTDNGNGTATIAGVPSNASTGPYPVVVTATNVVGPVAQNLTIQLMSSPIYVVNSAADPASGNASNCPQNGGTAVCTLRDALAASGATGGIITFSPTAFNAATTIQLSGTELTIPASTRIIGPTSGSGYTLANLVTIDAQQHSRIFFYSPPSGDTGVGEIDNLNLINGKADSTGGGAVLAASGNFTAMSCLFNDNSSSGPGGAIEEQADALTVQGSTFENNTASTRGGAVDVQAGGAFSYDTFYSNTAPQGGAINNYGLTTVINSTIVNNSYGGITNLPYNTYTYTGRDLTDILNEGLNLFAGNTGPQLYAPNQSFDTLNNGFLISIYDSFGGSLISDSNINLAPLGNYGGPTPTILPLPGSPAICYSAGTFSGIGSLVSPTDQRGLFPVNLTYGAQQSDACWDVGSVQTNYGLAFSAQPAPISPQPIILPATNFSAAVTLSESGVTLPLGSVTIPLSLAGTGTLTGGSASTASGIATYSALQVSSVESGDTLMASLNLNSSAPIAPVVSATSSPFAVAMGQPVVAFAPSPATQVYGDAIQPGSLNATATYNGAPLPGSFTYGTHLYNSTQALSSGYTGLPAGNYDVVATFTPADTTRYLTASASAPYTVTKATGSVALGNLSQTYTGSPLNASATTNPSGMEVSFTYNGGSTAPTTPGSYTVVGTIQDPNYQGSTTATMMIGKAPAQVTLGNLSQTYTGAPLSATATTNPSGLQVSFTYNGSSTPPTAAGIYTAVGTVQDPNYQGSAAAALSVARASSTTALHLSSTSITPGQSVTLSATVTSSAAGTPTGTVSFYDGSTLLNSTPAVLSGGVATFSTTALTPGSLNSITALYSGDTNFIGSSSTAGSSTSITVAPMDFTLNLSGSSNFTVTPGQSVTVQFTLSPNYGSYPGTITFATTGLPAGATLTFSPSSIPSNGGQQTVTLTIQTAAATASMLHDLPLNGRKTAPFTLAFLLLFGVGALRNRRHLLRRILCITILVAGLATTLLTGCGGNGSFQTPQNYSITVTATAGQVQHSTTITLNVQ